MNCFSFCFRGVLELDFCPLVGDLGDRSWSSGRESCRGSGGTSGSCCGVVVGGALWCWVGVSAAPGVFSGDVGGPTASCCGTVCGCCDCCC